MNTSEPTTEQPVDARAGSGLYAVAVLVALLGAAGSLALSIVLDLKACPLCFYQRSFVMAALGALLVGLLVPGAGARRTALAAGLLCAVAGFAVAVFHVYLEAAGTLACPDGVLALGSAPVQSLVMFTVLVGILAFATLPAPSTRRAGIVALLLGVAFAVGSIVSSPPLPSPPAEPYDAEPDVCRPPYEPAS